MNRRPHPFLRCDSGVAMIEFAFILPIIVVLLFGVIEMSRYALIHQKLDKTANALADFIGQSDETVVRRTDLDTYVGAARQIMTPLDFNGTIIFSSVTTYSTPTPPCNTPDVSCVVWQYSPLGADLSRIGSVGGEAEIPGSYGVISGQNAIIAEIYGDYEPMLAGTGVIIPSLQPHSIYKVAVYKPRLGSLTVLE